MKTLLLKLNAWDLPCMKLLNNCPLRGYNRQEEQLQHKDNVNRWIPNIHQYSLDSNIRSFNVSANVKEASSSKAFIIINPLSLLLGIVTKLLMIDFFKVLTYGPTLKLLLGVEVIFYFVESKVVIFLLEDLVLNHICQSINHTENMTPT